MDGDLIRAALEDLCSVSNPDVVLRVSLAYWDEYAGQPICEYPERRFASSVAHALASSGFKKEIR